MPTFLQWVHVTAAVIGVGGMAFLLLVLIPCLKDMPPEQRDPLAQRVMDRFRRVIWPAFAVSLVSGICTIRQYYWEAAWGKSWALLTVKIALSLIVFLIAFALTLPFKVFDRVRSRRQVWLSIAVGLAVAVILIAAYLRR